MLRIAAVKRWALAASWRRRRSIRPATTSVRAVDPELEALADSRAGRPGSDAACPADVRSRFRAWRQLAGCQPRPRSRGSRSRTRPRRWHAPTVRLRRGCVIGDRPYVCPDEALTPGLKMFGWRPN